jgi:hypothetical protein
MSVPCIFLRRLTWEYRIVVDTAAFSVSWKQSDWAPYRSLQFPTYRLAESFLISLVPQVDRASGGFIDLSHAGAVLLSFRCEEPGYGAPHESRPTADLAAC